MFRVEYVREPRNRDHPACHVHFHAESAALYRTAGRDGPALQEAHFPLSGARFRPTVEDVLLFLHREQLFTDWARPDWRKAVDSSRADWEVMQAKATARQHTSAVIEYLESVGYKVKPPGSSSS